MTKYRLLKPIPHTDYEVGHVFETDAFMEINYKVTGVFERSIEPDEIPLMVQAGILEEVEEEENKQDDLDWFTMVTSIGLIKITINKKNKTFEAELIEEIMEK